MFSCIECGYQSIKWLGRCPHCNSWESFEEKNLRLSKKSKQKIDFLEKTPPKLLSQVKEDKHVRYKTGISEFDKILGGGVITGEVVLVGGEPGIGKSTLLLQIASSLASNKKTLYLSAEESACQVQIRAKRLDCNFDKLYILNEDNLLDIYSYIEKEKFEVVIIDSIQVIFHPEVDSPRGSLNQIRFCSEFLTRCAKAKGVSFFIVGHVTKEGVMAGPKLLEHIVDCVLYFESEMRSHYRILRASKNRFGSTGEVAVFEMMASGLKEVESLSDIFLPHKDNVIPGSCIGCVVEGTKPMLLELQALVTKSSFGMVRRKCLGFDYNRFSLLIAAIEKRAKILLGNQDIFLNVAGGMKITDPAADLAVVLSIISSFKDKQLQSNSLFIGEVGLGGELRPVSHINLRLKEAAKGGFKKCFIPKGNLKEVNKESSLEIISLESIKNILSFIGG